MQRRTKKIFLVAGVVALLFQAGGFDGLVSLLPQKVAKVLQHTPFAAQPARAVGHYTPTGGALVTGNGLPITSGATTGNTGSWKGVAALETAPGLNWSVSSTAGGLDQQVKIDGVMLQDANKMVVTINASSGAASLTRYYQICDWVSSSNADHVGSNCTGAWRTMNKVNNAARSAIAEAAQRTLTYHIYDGYWAKNGTSTSNLTLSTPLSNFVSSTNGEVLIRAFSTSSTATTHLFNSVAVDLVVDPIYMPSSMTIISGTNTGYSNYVQAENPPTLISGTNTTGSDNLYAKVSGTVSAVADFYFSFSGVESYTGMNTILVSAEFGCSAIVAENYRPKIYNFFSSTFENISSNKISCTTTDAGGQFSVTSTSISNYISNGEVRIEWVGDSQTTTEIRIDYIYIIVGSTNTDSSQCEISLGTGAATDCKFTDGVDTTLASTSAWMVASELEKAPMTHTFYAYDNDADATNGEAANAENLNLPVTVPHNASVAGLVYATRVLPGSATVSTQPQFKDFAGQTATLGGWNNFGSVNNSSSTYAYSDYIGVAYTSNNPKDYIDTYNNTVNVRFRTGASTLLANFTRTIDFIMVSIRWVYGTPVHPTMSFQYLPTGGSLVNGTEMAIVANATTGNVGSWRGTLTNEAGVGFNWSVSNTATGLDQQLQFNHVAVQGANKMIVVINASSGAASLTRYYQICDWVSATNVDAVGSNCTGGGWRTLNKVMTASRSAIAETTQRTYAWHVYDGYWSGTPTSTTNTTTTTPLSNFVSSTDGQVLVRAFSTSTSFTTHMINYASITMVVDPVYMPAGMTVISGTNTGFSNYVQAENPPTLIANTNSTGSDNRWAAVSGTAGSIADYYLKFTKVRTYTGMNTILVAAETGCSTTGINYRMKIYNFNTPGWEDLSANLACAASGTDTAGYYALNNISIEKYVSSTLDGEVRVGIYGQSNGTQELRLDYLYIIVGTTNSDSANCNIDFGTGTVADCTKTRTIDTSSADSLWSITSALESTNMGSAYYALDNDADAVNAEAIEAGDLQFSVTVPTSTSLAGVVYAMRWRSGGTGITTRGQFRDFSGINTTISGGFTNFGTTNAATTTYTYEDPIASTNFVATPDDYVDYYNNEVMVRFRTQTATYLTNFTGDYDFIMVSLRWVVAPDTPDISMTIDSTSVDLGNLTPGTPVDGANTLTITTTNSTGYVVSIMKNDSASALDLIANSTVDIADKGLWVAPSATTTAGNAASWTGTGAAFHVRFNGTDTQNYASTWWGSDDDDPNALFAGIPPVAQTIANSSVAAVAGSALKVGYRIDVPGTQQIGAYDGTITYTATSNP